jgi:hypothetical protein
MVKKSIQITRSSKVIRSAKRGKAAKPIAVQVKPPERTTYECTLNGITPLLKGKTIGSLTSARAKGLAKSASLPMRDVRTLVAAYKAAEKLNFPSEVLFALTRDGKVLQANELAQFAPDELRAQLESAVNDGLISSSVIDSFNTFKPILEQLQISHAPLRKISDQLNLNIPPAITSLLAKKKISTLEDILRSGGLANQDYLKLDDPNLKVLDAIANLTLVSTDLQVNKRLVDHGYSHILDIADETPKRFAARMEGSLDSGLSTRIHTVASVQARILSNEVTANKIETQFSLGLAGNRPLDKVLSPQCGCDDCHEATSPLAYLADLLNYAMRHVRFNGNPITLADLEGKFHQPFRNLPTNCEVLQRQIPQARIAIEILRAAHLAAGTPRFYLEGVYHLLLEQNGTSFDELRNVAFSQDKAVRLAYANKLGITLHAPSPNDEIDQLFLRPGQFTESDLEHLFGLRDTNRPPEDSDQEGQLLELRMHHLRDLWYFEDWPNGNLPKEPRIFVDPDLVLLNDTKGLGSPSHKFWVDRNNQVSSRLTGLTDLRLDPAIGLDKLLRDGQFGLGTAPGLMDGPGIQEVLDLFHDFHQGKDISNSLVQFKLDIDALDYLGSIVQLYNDGKPISDEEWKSFNSILLQRAKKNLWYPTWQKEEYNAALVLSQDFFVLNGGSVADGSLPWKHVIPWRSTAEERIAWESTLHSRIKQQESLYSNMQQALRTTEEALLVKLRDSFLLHEDKKNLSRKFLINIEAGACQMTTRVAQAIETIQGLLFDARNGLLDDNSITLDADHFNEEWKWLGSYATWRAAMLVFLYPENTLRPSLLAQKSPAFTAFVARLQELDHEVTPENIQEDILRYVRYFADVCTLKPAAFRQSESYLPIGLGAQGTERRFKQRVLALGKGAVSGRFFFSKYDQIIKPSIYPGLPPVILEYLFDTLWTEIIGLPGESEIVSIVPYQPLPGDNRIGLYSRISRPGGDKIYFTSFDGLSWTKVSSELTELPILLKSSEIVNGYVSTDRALTRDTKTWTSQVDDRLVAADIDGDGCKEIIVFAKTPGLDRRIPFAILRERDGGLVVTWSDRLPLGWDVPANNTVVLQTHATEKSERLLVVNQSNPALGVLGSKDDGLGLLSTSTTGWTVNPLATFVAADLDGTGTSELVVVEHNQTRDSYDPVETIFTVLHVSDSGFSFLSKQTAVAPRNAYWKRNSAGHLGAGFNIKWERLTKLHDINRTANPRDVLLAIANRTEYDINNQNPETYVHVALFHWDAQIKELTYSDGVVSRIYSDHIDAVGNQNGWGWSTGVGDQFVVVNREKDQRTTADAIIVLSPVGATAILERQADGQYAVVWQQKAGDIASAGKGANAPVWNRAGGDKVIPADIQGDGWQKLIVVDSKAENVAVLNLLSDGAPGLETCWADTRVRQPDGNGEWILSTTTFYITADIDGDGQDEIVLQASDGGKTGRLGVLRGFPRSLFTQGQAIPQRFGPLGVSVLSILPNGVNPKVQDDFEMRRVGIKQAYEANAYLGLQHNQLYLDEAYYMVPMEIGIRLLSSGNYTAALDWFRSVYDYDKPINERKIAYNLMLDAGQLDIHRGVDWLLDPLNPHAIAQVRKGSYTKFTLLTIINCLLADADAEFTRATSESVSRARELYVKVLQLLDESELNQHTDKCLDLIGKLSIKIGDDEDIWVLDQIKQGLRPINDYSALVGAVKQIQPVLASEASSAQKLNRAQEIITKLSMNQLRFAILDQVIGEDARLRRNAVWAVLTNENTLNAITMLGDSDGIFIGVDLGQWEQVSAPELTACIPLNRAIQATRDHAMLNQHKIDTCRNIAGMEMQLEPYAGTTAMMTGSGDQLPSPDLTSFQPLPYRYATLIERARQLVDLARQIEASMLGFLEKADFGRFEELKARQDLSLVRAGLRLKDLQLAEANDSIVLANLQRHRAAIQKNEYDRLLKQDVSALEYASLALLGNAVILHSGAAVGSLGAGIYTAILTYYTGNPGGYVTAAEQLSSAQNSAASMFSTMASITSALATYERRRQEWQYELALASQDVSIGQQQIVLANDRVNIAGQERAISNLQVNNAQAVIDFLANKFLNADLYDWMSSVNEQVYRFFLQQATSIAKVAQQQLAFERQEAVQTFIKVDYWERPKEGMSPDVSASGTSGELSSLKGLTGSARLLRDIYELDQYAFRTNQRKLQLTETISLAQHDPFAFQHFRDTGVLHFDIPQELFDRKFPGHYLRLIKRVRTSVIALIPPVIGIRATLSTRGTSRAVIGHDTFQEVVIQRGPESVALTSPINATGLFELDAQLELIPPFEGIGVDSAWEIRMPKTANQFDYRTIADILLTIEYTALDSYDYRQQVIKKLEANREFSADRSFSFHNEFADAWYDLNNPDLVEPPAVAMKVSVETFREDFPPNLEDLQVQQVIVYFVQDEGKSVKVTMDGFSFTPPATDLVPNPNSIKFGSANSDDRGVISTRQNKWMNINQAQVAGTWTFSLPNDRALKSRFIEHKIYQKGDIKDILFVITYSGRLPEWPV